MTTWVTSEQLEAMIKLIEARSQVLLPPEEAIRRLQQCKNTCYFQPYPYMNQAINTAIAALRDLVESKTINEECQRYAIRKQQGCSACSLDDVCTSHERYEFYKTKENMDE